jgi:hypothetical protein
MTNRVALAVRQFVSSCSLLNILDAKSDKDKLEREESDLYHLMGLGANLVHVCLGFCFFC